jgi:hypothetical protein
LGFSTASLPYQNEPTCFHGIACGEQLSGVQREPRQRDATTDGDPGFVRSYDDMRFGGIALTATGYDFRYGRIVDIPESQSIVMAQNDTNQYLSRPEDQRRNYATRLTSSV